MHGLHAAEAVTALQEHLWKIESQVPINQLVSANSLKGKSSIMAPALSLSANYGNSEKLGMRAASSRSRATSLQVITGDHLSLQYSLWRNNSFRTPTCMENSEFSYYAGVLI